MKKVIELKEKCQECDGTGLYVGLGERNGAAVVCHECQGTGCHSYRHEYEDFTCRVRRPGVTRVLQANPGISVGEGNGCRLEDFGGMSVEDWEAGKPFELGMEMRKCVCPAWWYQSADYKLKPKWKECIGCGSFSRCLLFKNKDKCWERFDQGRKRVKK